jgi:Fic family protein
MDEYIEFVNHPRLIAGHPVIRALLAHFFLVTIHPFGDGNGRVSRLVEGRYPIPARIQRPRLLWPVKLLLPA